MNKDLEKYISDNRGQFDNESPNEGVWDKISEGLKGSLVSTILKRQWRPLFAAASVVALILLAYFILDRRQRDQPVNASNFKQENESIKQYTYEVNAKSFQLSKLKNVDPDLIVNFQLDLKGLDSSYKELKTSVKYAPNRDQVIKAMIENLQLQITLLNKQLEIANQLKSKSLPHENAL
jgi:hypothetical protein